MQNMFGLHIRLDSYPKGSRMLEGCAVSALRMTEGCRGDAPLNTRNTADEAFDRISVAFGLPNPDAETLAQRERYSDSAKGLVCYDCGHNHSPRETIYYGSVRGWGFCSHTYKKASYCESCKPSLWNTEYANCDTCNRTVYYPYRNIDRRHLFCSEKCGRDHYNNVQREKRLRNRQKECDGCSKAFTAPRSDTKFCSTACKQKAYRQRQAERQAQ